MLGTLQRLLDVEMTIAEWLGTGFILAIPYLALGVAWTAANAERFDGLHGLQLILTLVGAVLSWPVLWLPGVCAT
jgi:hypothetical protein